MLFFKRSVLLKTPAPVDKYHKETHQAASNVSKNLEKINKLLNNGITLQIHRATREGHDGR